MHKDGGIIYVRYCRSYAAASRGAVKEISWVIDLDYVYRDYPEVIKAKGLNGCKEMSWGTLNCRSIR